MTIDDIGDGGYLLDPDDFYYPEDEQPEAQLKQKVEELLTHVDAWIEDPGFYYEPGLELLVEEIRELL